MRSVQAVLLDGWEQVQLLSDRRIEPAVGLRDIPVTIALAAGASTVPSLLAAARAGYFNQLVIGSDTALALLAAL